MGGPPFRPSKKYLYWINITRTNWGSEFFFFFLFLRLLSRWLTREFFALEFDKPKADVVERRKFGLDARVRNKREQTILYNLSINRVRTRFINAPPLFTVPDIRPIFERRIFRSCPSRRSAPRSQPRLLRNAHYSRQ